jgi:hypothetical protein
VALVAFLGGYRLKNFAFKPAQGVRGGILILWDSDYITLRDIDIASFSIIVYVTVKACGSEFRLTSLRPVKMTAKAGFSKPHEKLAAERWHKVADCGIFQPHLQVKR